MFFGYIICFFVGIMFYFIFYKFNLFLRSLSAIFIFIILAFLLTIFFYNLEDKPLGKSRTITKKEWREIMKESQEMETNISESLN